MRKSLRSTIATTSIFAMAAIVMATAGAEAKNRPTVSSALSCTDDPDADVGSGGSITYCCYDDGCYICGVGWRDCVWDPAYRAGKRPKFIPKGNLPELQPVEPKMEPKVQPKGGIQQQ